MSMSSFVDMAGKVGLGKTFTLPGERKLVINPTYDHSSRAVDVEVQQVRRDLSPPIILILRQSPETQC